MAIGAVTAAHLGSTALGAAAGAVAGALAARWWSGSRSRGCRGRGSPSRAGSSRGSSPSACSRSAGRSAGRRESWSPEARHRPSTTSSGSCSRLLAVVVYAALARAPIGLQLAAAREREPAADSAAGSDRAAADRGARRVGRVRRPRRSARRASRRGGRSRLVQPVPLLQALRRRADRRAAVRPRRRGRRARARRAVGGRRRDRLARTRRRRALAHAPRGDHAARRHLARLGRHRAAGAAQAPFRRRGEARPDARRRASRRVGSPSATATSPQPRTSTSMSRQGGSPPSSARTAPGRRRCSECSRAA